MIKKDLGFLLRRHALRETSLIATLYTLNSGKIRGVFKAFYTPKREFTTSLDILTLNELVFYPKKRELWLVSFADLVCDYPFIREDRAKGQVAAVFANLVDKVLPLWDSHPDIFCLLKDCLYWLRQEDEGKVLYIFLIKLLTLSGFRPEFGRCLRCHATLGRETFFSVSRGGLLCKNCRQSAADAQLINREVSSCIRYIQDTAFPQVLRIRPSFACQRSILNILREFIFYHLDFDISPYLPAEQVPLGR